MVFFLKEIGRDTKEEVVAFKKSIFKIKYVEDDVMD